jgi:hypothetical protein
MKKLIVNFVGSAAIFALILTISNISLAAQKAQTFNGEIIDQQCALLGGHSAMMNKGESAKDCTNRCVKIGGKYVLYDAGTKTIYQLDDQKKPEEFAGSKVKITGTFDSSSKTIHVTNIQAGS